MAKAKRAQRVQVVADKRTRGAMPGAVAYPLKTDLDAWLAKGWHVAEDTAAAAEDPAGTADAGDAAE